MTSQIEPIVTKAYPGERNVDPWRNLRGWGKYESECLELGLNLHGTILLAFTVEFASFRLVGKMPQVLFLHCSRAGFHLPDSIRTRSATRGFFFRLKQNFAVAFLLHL